MSEIMENKDPVVMEDGADSSFAEMLEESLKSLNTDEKVHGVVVGIAPNEIYVDVGRKQAGFVPLSELSADPNAKAEDLVKIVKEETDGLGADHCVEAVASMLADCVPLVRPHGKILQFGHDELSHPEFPVAELLKNEIEVYGGYLGKYYMRKVAQIIESGILPLDKIVTDVIPASRYQEALDLAASRQCGKVFVSMDL